MADAEISYNDAFGSQPQQGIQPQVPLAGGGTPEISYNEAFPQEKPGVFRQALTAFSPYGALDLHQSIGNIAHAFGDSIQQSAEDIQQNLSGNGGDLVDSLKKSGMWQPYVQDQNEFNKGFFFKTAVPSIQNFINSASEASFRGLSAAANAAMVVPNLVGSGIGQAVEELPLSDELKDYAQSGAIFADFPGIEHTIPPKEFRIPEGVAKGVIGTTEGQNSGVQPLTEDQHIKQAVAEAQVNPVMRAEAISDMSSSEPNIHDYARAIAPDTFSRYDDLAEQRDALRTKLAENPESSDSDDIRDDLKSTNSEMRDLAPEVSNAYLKAQEYSDADSVNNIPPSGEYFDSEKNDLAQEINKRDEQGRLLNPVNDPLWKSLDESSNGFYSHDSNIDALKWAIDNNRDDIANKLLDKAKKNSDDMAKAAQQDPNNFSQRAEEAAEQLKQTQNLVKLRTEERGRPLSSGAPSYDVPEEMKLELAKKISPIVEDITNKLKNIGQPEDQARAGAEIAARMYQYFSDVYGGQKGTAQDWYERESPEIKGVKEKAMVLAQPKEGGASLSQKVKGSRIKGSLTLATNDARAVMRLMAKADASTFVHESAHHFLDMMDRFSKEENVPQRLKDDMAIIRKWSGLSEKEPETAKEEKAWTRAQEKFARGFERYLMEGVAPTKDMALVFAKFKKWMTDIYKSIFIIPNQAGGINEDVRSFFDRVLSKPTEKIVIAPDHPAENLKDNIGNQKLGDLFNNVPRAPKTLTEWLARRGGIKGDSDLFGMDADKSHINPQTGRPIPFANKLIKENGMDLDEAARAAHEAGYFPEKGEERPSIQELKEKIMEDLTGNKQYSDKEHEALNNHEDALRYNAQIDKIASDTGVNPSGKSHDEFFDEVAKHYDEEGRYHEAQNMASDAQNAFDEYERKEREFIDSRGDSWEPPSDDTPTFEEMENERRQAIASQDTLQSTRSPPEPEYTAEADESGEADVRQGGGGSQPDGRTGQDETAPEPGTVEANELAARQQLDAARAAIADAPLGETAAPEPNVNPEPNAGTNKSEFYDKAGNVRLDLLTDSDSIKAAMREAAEKNPQLFNHDVITDAQVAEFADAMGVDARELNIQKLRSISVDDNIPLAARIRSGSQMMVDALNHSLELMNKENPTDEDVAKFLDAKNQFLMIAETVSATTNEMGRAFRAYNNLMKEYNVTDIHEAAELFQRMTGRTLDDVKKEMKAGSLLRTPKQIARFTNDSLQPNFMDKLLEYRNNSLLSGPVTHTFYTAAGFLNSAYKPLQTLAGLAVQSAREALGAEINERMYAEEALAQFNAIGYGSMRGLKAAMESWKQNSELALPKEIASAPLLKILDKTGLENVEGAGDLGWLPRKQAIEGKLGTAINAPSRLIGSIHSFQKMLNYQQNLAQLATREALRKGLDPKSDEFAKFVSDTIDKPPASMMDDAGESSLKEVYREKVDYNSFSGKLFNVINSNPVTKVLFPFIKMQYNIKRVAFRDNSVLGLFDKSIRADISGVNGDVAKNMAIGKIAAGTAIAGLGISMTMQGLNNGNGPSDPKAYKTWRLTHTPNSVQIGSLVIPHKALGTWGQLLSWSADMAEGSHEFNTDDIDKSAMQFLRKAGAVFTEEGFMTQAKNTLDAAFTPEQFGSRFIQNFATQWLPFSVGFSQTNKLLGDDTVRRVKSQGISNLWGVPEAMEYKYPGTSELLQPSRDMFGQPIQSDYLSSAGYDKYASDPVVLKLKSLQTGMGRLNDKIKGVQLTEQQYDDYSRIAGQMTYARLSKLVKMNGFDQMPPQHQLQLIESTTTQARNMAANTVMKMNPEIIQQANIKKRMSIYGNKIINDSERQSTEDVNNP